MIPSPRLCINMGIHAQPNKRPVHPECPARRSFGDLTPCTCDALWAEWDGTYAELLDRVEAARKRELRRTPLTTRGYGIDTDEHVEVTLEDFERTSYEDIPPLWSNRRFLDQHASACIVRDPSDPKLQESLDRLRKHIVDNHYWDHEKE